MSALGPSTGVPAKKRDGVAAPATAGRTSGASAASRAMRRAMDGRGSLQIDRTGRRNATGGGAESYGPVTMPSARASSRKARRGGLRVALVPAQGAGHRRRHALRRRALGVGDAARGQQRDAGAAQQRIAHADGLLAARRVDGLGQQVGGPAGHDRLGQLAALAGHGEDLVGRMAVAAGEALVGLVGHALHARQVGGVDGLAQRHLVRAARGGARLALDQAVDGHLGHPPPRRQLAARDGDHPARGLVELGLARDVDRLLRVAGGDQRSHAGVGARDVLAARGRRRSRR